MRRIDRRILQIVKAGTPHVLGVARRLLEEGTGDLSWWDRFCFSHAHVYGRMQELVWEGLLERTEGTERIPERDRRDVPRVR
jgi:hypothetical protein